MPKLAKLLPEDEYDDFQQIRRKYRWRNRMRSFILGIALPSLVLLLYLLIRANQNGEGVKSLFIPVSDNIGYILLYIIVYGISDVIISSIHTFGVDSKSWKTLIRDSEKFQRIKRKLGDSRREGEMFDQFAIYAYLKLRGISVDDFLLYFKDDQWINDEQSFEFFKTLLSGNEVDYYKSEIENLPFPFKVHQYSTMIGIVLFIPILVYIIYGFFKLGMGIILFELPSWLSYFEPVYGVFMILLIISYIPFNSRMKANTRDIELLIFEDIFEKKGVMLDIDDTKELIQQLAEYYSNYFERFITELS